MLEGLGSNAEGIEAINHVEHVRSIAEEAKATRQDQVQAERSSGRQEEEGVLERSRAGCQERADTESKHTMPLKDPKEEQLQVRFRFFCAAAGLSTVGCLAVGREDDWAEE